MIFYRHWRDGREAEGNGLLNRHTFVKMYRGFESLSLRQGCVLDDTMMFVICC